MEVFDSVIEALSPVIEALKTLMFILLAIAGFVAGLFAVCGIAIWVFRPIDRAARNRRHPAQFTLADFLCLFFLVQLAMVLPHSLASPEESGLVWLIDGYGWIAAGLLWWFGVQNLYRAGIRNPWHRGIFLALVVPVTFVSTIAVPMLVVAIYAGFIQANSWTTPFLLMALECALIVGVYASGRFTRHIVALGVPPAESPLGAAADGDEFHVEVVEEPEP